MVTKAPLSRREQEVAALVAEGLTNRAIAERLFISERTVDGHLEHIREKLGVSSRAQVATWHVAQAQVSPASLAVQADPGPRRRGSSLFLAVAALAVLALVATLALPRLLAPPNPAGPLITSFKGTTPADQLNGPEAIAVSTDGSVYIADSANFRIEKIDLKQGTLATFAGGNNDQFVDGTDALAASIGNPTGVAVAPDGKTVYFANGLMVGRIGLDRTVHPVPTDLVVEPFGLAFTSDGRLYIVDRRGNAVWMRQSDGQLIRFAGTGHAGAAGDGGTADQADLDRPRAVAVDAVGNVLIADTGNNRIRRVDHVSGVITTIAGGNEIYDFGGDGGPADHAKLGLPCGVAVGSDGSIYVADTANNRVRRITSSGSIVSVVGGHGELNGPTGLATSSSGDLYIADMGDSQFYVLRKQPTT